ncbi:hypothetical protein [Aliikangiella sp. G2MR2-5]|uniref:hypothetical protein n=1 Tax=Aliikangiella sp. G2MR2-5 TaxID=2788943 RepID=UPI0018AA96EE|nr:hypothetical protein [Aliikangiella sp. G2MR2-5]
MNKIEALDYKSKFAATEHLVIAVDGTPLDVFLESILKDENHIGLVPAISWLDNSDERQIAIDKSFPSVGNRTVGPILVCPDDQDFSCTVIVADIETTDTSIIWHRLGLDKTDLQSPPKIGLDVEWYDQVPALEFALDDYQSCMSELENEAA